jgi:hypothetical protein
MNRNTAFLSFCISVLVAGILVGSGYCGITKSNLQKKQLLYPSSCVLLVSDQVDGVSAPQFFDSAYISAVLDNNFAYVLWDHNVYGSPTLDDLQPYSAIIWYTGNSGQYPADDPNYGHLTLTLEEERTLVNYLNSGDQDRILILSGMWIAWNCVANADTQTQLYSNLFSAMLGLSYTEDNFNNWIDVDDDWTIAGVGDDFYDSTTYELNWASQYNYPDQLEAVSPGSTTATWQDPSVNSHHYSCIYAQGLKIFGSGMYHLALLSCPIESINDTDLRNEIIYNLLTWGGTHTINVQPVSLGEIKSLFR